MRYFIMALFASCCAASLMQGPRASDAAARGRAEGSQGAVMGRIVGRNQTVVVRAGAKGSRYSVEDKDGQVVVPGMTLRELAAKKPESAHTVQTLQADVDTRAAVGSD